MKLIPSVKSVIIRKVITEKCVLKNFLTFFRKNDGELLEKSSIIVYDNRYKIVGAVFGQSFTEVYKIGCCRNHGCNQN